MFSSSGSSDASQSCSTHYEVLGVDSSVSYSELKKAFNSLARRSHPDSRKRETQSASESVSPSFLKVQKAWEILRDDASRKEYDERLRLAAIKSESVWIAYRLSLADCDAVDDACVEYPCRCGSYFCFELPQTCEQLLAEKGADDSTPDLELILSCDLCSLRAKLVI